MADNEALRQAAADLQDPDTTAEQLSRIAVAHPSLRTQVAAHPNVFPELLTWLAGNGNPATKAAVAVRQDKLAAAAAKQPAPKAPGVPGVAEPEEAPKPRHPRVQLVIIIVLAVALVAAGVGLAFTSGLFGDGATGRTVTGPVDPPDGDSQRAWITVPSDNTKPGALVVDMHIDYQCPICEMVETAYDEMFVTLSDRGDIILRLHTRTFLDRNLGNISSSLAAIAAACVDVADGTKYAAYSNTIYANQPKQEGTGYTGDQLRNQFAVAAGLKGADLATFQSCYDNQATWTWVNDVNTNNYRATPNNDGTTGYLFGGNTPNIDTTGQTTGTAGAAYGVTGVPSIFVNGNTLQLGMIMDNAGNPTANSVDALLAVLAQVGAGQ